MLDLLRSLKELPSWEWPPEAYKYIRSALASTNPETRGLAAQLAHAVIDDELAQTLSELVGADPSAEVAAAAAIGLGPALEECSDEYDDVVLDAVAGLPEMTSVSRLVYLEAVNALATAYQDERRPDLVRRRSLEASVRAPRPWHSAAVSETYKRPEVDWRATAIFCMGYVPGFEMQILRELDSDEPTILQEAIRAAGRKGLEAAGAHVMRVASDETAAPDLRIAAIETLETIDPPGSQKLLEILSEAADADLAEAATHVLEERSIGALVPDDEAQNTDELPN